MDDNMSDLIYEIEKNVQRMEEEKHRRIALKSPSEFVAEYGETEGQNTVGNLCVIARILKEIDENLDRIATCLEFGIIQLKKNLPHGEKRT